MLRNKILVMIIINLVFSGCAPVMPPVRKGRVPSQQIIKPPLKRLTDEEFLDFIQRKAFAFFWNEANSQTGLIRDRANNFSPDNNKIASVASVAFGLTAICIAHEREWITYEQAYKRALTTLKFFQKNMGKNHGFYYHFVHLDTGQPTVGSEVSSIDTALFLAGVLLCGEYFKGTEIEKTALELYERVEWPWMLAGGLTFCMGYNNRKGFSAERYNHYSETMLLYLLAIGSPTHPIPPDTWHEIYRPVRSYKKYTLICFPSLFAHQYSHLWIDFRNKSDDYADYFKNSVKATLANRQFCIDNAGSFKTYSSLSWGLTACDGPKGYEAYGALPSTFRPKHDGTVAPTAAAGSIEFTPDISLACLKNIYNRQGEGLWGRYGFSDAFNLDRNWYAKDVIGIDQGAILLSIENYRTAFVWNTFMRLPFIKKALELAGFKEGAKEVSQPPVPVYEAHKTIPSVTIPSVIIDSSVDERDKDNKITLIIKKTLELIGFRKGTKKVSQPPVPVYETHETTPSVIIDGSLDEWDKSDRITLTVAKNLDYGAVTDPENDLVSEVYFSWDQNFLYLAAQVYDNDLINYYSDHYLYKGDIIELFLDPEANGLVWAGKKDFQIGLAPVSETGKPATFAWFQRIEPSTSQINVAAEKLKINGQEAYCVEAAISWDFLGMKPQAGQTIGASVAVHDLDEKDNTPQCKLNWYFVEDFSEDKNGFELGKIKLSE